MQKHFFISTFSFLLLIAGCLTEKSNYGLNDDVDTMAQQPSNIYRAKRLRRQVEKIKQERIRQEQIVNAYNKQIREAIVFSIPEDTQKKQGECSLCLTKQLVYRYCFANNQECTIWQCETCCKEMTCHYKSLELIGDNEYFPYTVTALEARCSHCRKPLPGAKQVSLTSYKFYTNGDINTIMN